MHRNINGIKRWSFISRKKDAQKEKNMKNGKTITAWSNLSFWMPWLKM